MRQTIKVNEKNFPGYASMLNMAIGALTKDNLKIVVRGRENRKNNLTPIERYDLNFYIGGTLLGATVFMGTYTEDELKTAIANTERLAILGSMIDVLKDGGVPVDEWEPDGSPVTVLTTRGGMEGAGVIYCDTILEKIRKKVGDFYILPSSIHEVLITPVSCDIERTELEAMVRTINRDEVSMDDKLSDRVYLFDGTLH